MSPARGWIPCRVVWDRERPLVDWCYLGDTQFTDATFSETIARGMQRPFSAAFLHRTPLDELELTGPDPAGMIFHLSRSGVEQLSASLRTSGVTVFAQPPIDTILSSPDRLRRFVRAVASAANVSTTASTYILELAPWQALDLAQFAAAFPSTPWIFLYRDPREVLASLASIPAEWTLPGFVKAERFGFDPATVEPGDLARYRTQLIEGLLRAVRECKVPGGQLVNSNQLPDSLFGISLRERS